MGFLRVSGAAVMAVITVVVAPGVASADPVTIVNTRSGPTAPLQVDVDIASGLWVGTPLVAYPGTCSMLVWRSYPPQNTASDVEDSPVSEAGSTLTYRINSGATVKLSSDCAWARVSE